MSKEKILLLTLSVIQFSHITDFMILMPLGPQLMEAFQILPSQFALLVSTYTFSAGTSGFVGAFFIDRFDRRKAILTMATGFALGTLACGFAQTYYWLLLTRSVTGLFGGVMGALILSIIGDAIPNERRATAMGMVMAAFSVASVIGVPAGLFLADLSDWHMPFIVLGVLAFLTLIPMAVYIPSMTGHISSHEDKPSPLQIIRNVTSNKNQLLALAFGSVIMFSHFTIVPFISPYLTTNVGFSDSQIKYVYLVGGALTVFTSPFLGRLADKYGRSTIFTFTVLAASVPIFFLTQIGETPIGLVLVITALFFVFGAGRMVPSTAMVTSSVKPQNRGSFMSFNASFRQLTNGVAAFFAGLIITIGEDGLYHNYDLVGYFAIAMGIVSIFISRKIKIADDESFTN
jgi:predicted MFS family arabinose efflux permease